VRSVSHRSTHVSTINHLKTDAETHPPRRNWISRVCSQHVKRRIAAGYHPPYNTAVKNVWSCFSTAYLLSGKVLPYIEKSLHLANVSAQNHQRTEDGASNRNLNRKQKTK